MTNVTLNLFQGFPTCLIILTKKIKRKCFIRRCWNEFSITKPLLCLLFCCSSWSLKPQCPQLNTNLLQRHWWKGKKIKRKCFIRRCGNKFSMTRNCTYCFVTNFCSLTAFRRIPQSPSLITHFLERHCREKRKKYFFFHYKILY